MPVLPAQRLVDVHTPGRTRPRRTKHIKGDPAGELADLFPSRHAVYPPCYISCSPFARLTLPLLSLSWDAGGAGANCEL